MPMIKFDLFAFVAERGWQEWMDEFAEDNPDIIPDLLFNTYDFAKMTLAEVRERYGLSRAAACRIFHVPIRTFEDWERKNQIPEYTKCLLCYALYTGV